MLEERPGGELVGWRYSGPFDELPAVKAAFGERRSYEHRVVAWDEVTEDEGTGIVHIAPGAGAEDYQLGKAHRPAGHRAADRGRPLPGRLRLAVRAGRAGRDRARSSTDLEERGFFYHLEPYTHRYPHCWRCGTALLFRVVDEWYISMGEVYDKPRTR